MSTPAPRPDRRFLAATLAAQAAAALWTAFARRDSLNPDGIAYLLNAGHYARGEWDLAVNGYWGPMLSWLLAPLVAAGTDPLLAAHAVVAASSLVFTAGAHSVLAAALDDRAAVRIGTVLAALAAVTWSADTVTPDLLVGGLFALGAGALLRTDADAGPRPAFAAGLWIGVAYLAKAIALPSGLAFVAALAALRAWSSRGRLTDQVRWAGAAAAGAALVAIPWIAVLSAHYGRPVFSTTGAIAHSVVGPGDVDRWYPTFRTFHDPGPGRLTSWEEPTHLPYAYWSPFAGAGLLRHQIRVVGNNAAAILEFVRGFDVLALGVAASALGFVAALTSRAALAAERWRLAAAGSAAVCAPYLPVFCDAGRYFWPALPFLLASALGLALRLSRDAPPVLRRAALALVAVSFALGLVSFDIPGFPHSVPARPGLAEALRPRPDGRVAASRRIASSLAGAGTGVWSDCREGLYVAWFAGLPWHGQEDDSTPARVESAGAAIVVTRAGSALDRGLAGRDGWSPVADGGGGPLRAWVRAPR